MRAGLLAGVSAAVLLAQAGAAGAQEAVIEELVVTAEKRETNLQTTALAVSAVSGDLLQRQQVTNVEALAQLLPNVNFGATTGNARIAIRGIGFDNSTVGGEGRVAYHVDGVYVSRPAAALATLFDLERIEVLRGPQGTLYGRNATGGAINVISRAAGDELNGYISGTVGNYELLKVEGAVGGPVAEGLAFRLAFQTHDRDGFGRNVTNGLPVDDMRTRAVKGRVEFRPSDSLSITLSGDYMTEQDHAYSFHLFGPGSLPDPALGLPGAPLKGVLAGGAVAADPRDSAADTGPHNDREFYGLAAHVQARLGGFDIAAVTGFRHAEFRIVSDLDGTSARLTHYDQEERSDTFSQELRISRDWGGGDVMIGAYYFEEDLFGGTRIPLDRLVLAPPPLPPLSGLRQGFFGMGFIDTRAYAVFGHVRFRLGEAFAIRLGGRYSDEKKDIDEANKIDPVTPWPPYAPIFPPTPPGARRATSASWSDFNPSVTLEYRPNEDLFLYATYAEGFKSGGFNLGNVQPPFAQETIRDYEAGLRADWLDGRLRTNVTVFFYDYKNLQVSKVNGPVITIENAASAELYGLEAEVTAMPTPNLRIDAALALLESEYKDYVSPDPARPALGPIDLAGNALSQAPNYTFNLAVTYDVPTQFGDLTFRAEGRWIDRVYFTPYNLEHVSQEAWSTFNAFATWRAREGGWSATAFVRNLTDEEAISSALVGSGLVGFPLVGSLEPPRTYGLTLSYEF